jgi:hypothetical protein
MRRRPRQAHETGATTNGGGGIAPSTAAVTFDGDANSPAFWRRVFRLMEAEGGGAVSVADVFTFLEQCSLDFVVSSDHVECALLVATNVRTHYVAFLCPLV